MTLGIIPNFTQSICRDRVQRCTHVYQCRVIRVHYRHWIHSLDVVPGDEIEVAGQSWGHITYKTYEDVDQWASRVNVFAVGR